MADWFIVVLPPVVAIEIPDAPFMLPAPLMFRPAVPTNEIVPAVVLSKALLVTVGLCTVREVSLDRLAPEETDTVPPLPCAESVSAPEAAKAEFTARVPLTAVNVVPAVLVNDPVP